MITIRLFKKFFSKIEILIIIFLLTTLTALETIGFAVLMPLISFIVEFNEQDNSLKNHIFFEFLYKFFDDDKFVILNAYLFLVFFYYLFKFLFTLTTIRIYSKLLFEFRNKVTQKILKNFLYKPYVFHLNSNSSDLVRYTSDEIKYYFDSVVSPMILVIVEIFIISGLIIFSFIISPYLFMLTILFSLVCYFLVRIIKKQLPKLGKLRLENELKRHGVLQQIFVAIKDIKIFKRESLYANEIKYYTKNLSEVDRKFYFLESLPRHIIEFLVVVFFVIFFYFFFNKLQNSIDLINYLPIFGIYVLIIFRIMPSFTRVSRAINAINYSKKLESKIYGFLNNLEVKDSNISNLNYDFQKSIEVKSISFQYDQNSYVINYNKPFKILKGTFNCIIGRSGSGKTTLLDILSGLLKVEKSEIYIDGNRVKNKALNLKNKISFVNQNFYLFNDTIRNNIIFLEDKKNKSNLKIIDELIEICELGDLIKKLSQGLDTIIGELGTKLSGGERQRLSIARALYSDADIIFFDEATNALDKDTEQRILNNLKNKYKDKKTFIMVIHKVHDKSIFDQIIELE